MLLHAIEGFPRQAIDDARLLGDDTRGAGNVPVEAHLAHHRVAHHAAKPDRTAELVLDGDGDATRCQQLDQVRRLALTEQGLPHFELVALEVRRDARHVGGAAQLRGQPGLEAMRRGFSDLMVHQHHVLAPFERFVAADKHLMRLTGHEKPRPFEAELDRIAHAGEGERDAMLVAVVAELDQAQQRRRVEAGHRAEIQHDIADRLFLLGVDRPPDALEQAVG